MAAQTHDITLMPPGTCYRNHNLCKKRRHQLMDRVLTCLSRTSPPMGPSRWSCMIDCPMLAVLLLRRAKKLRHAPLGRATAMSRPTCSDQLC